MWIKNLTRPKSIAGINITILNSKYLLFYHSLLIINDSLLSIIDENTIYQIKRTSIKSNMSQKAYYSLRENCEFSQFFWSAFSRFWTEDGKIQTRITCVKIHFLHSHFYRDMKTYLKTLTTKHSLALKLWKM